MSVVINDLQVEEQPEPASPVGSAPPAVDAARTPPPPTLWPEDIERIVRRLQERRARLTAD